MTMDTSTPNESAVKKSMYYRIDTLEDAVKMLVNQVGKSEGMDIPNLSEAALYLQYGDNDNDWTIKISRKNYIKAN